MQNRTNRRIALALGAVLVLAAQAFTLSTAAPPAGQMLAVLGDSPLWSAAGTVVKPVARGIASGAVSLVADASIALMRGGIEIGRAATALTPDGPVCEDTGPSGCVAEADAEFDVVVDVESYSVATVDFCEGTNCSMTAVRIIDGGSAPCASTKSLNFSRSNREPSARSAAVRSSMRRL